VKWKEIGQGLEISPEGEFRRTTVSTTKLGKRRETVTVLKRVGRDAAYVLIDGKFCNADQLCELHLGYVPVVNVVTKITSPDAEWEGGKVWRWSEYVGQINVLKRLV
jgi:hypothetical protein